MCRLFGFKSITDGQVHQSLIHADNALEVQSKGHPDGWGVCYYLNGCPHLIKSEKTAVNDSIFKKVSGIVYSNTVMAHLRKATLGNINLLNTHPFQHGNWSFAHNGNIKDFDKYKDQILCEISPELKRFILGSTDSEVIFYYLLSSISKKFDLKKRNFTKEELLEIVKTSIQNLSKIIGESSKVDDCGPHETYLTFLLSDGDTMLAHQGGKNLNYSTYKTHCKEADTCKHYSANCEAPSTDNIVNHLIFSSEPINGDNIWVPMSFGQLIVIDKGMHFIIG